MAHLDVQDESLMSSHTKYDHFISVPALCVTIVTRHSNCFMKKFSFHIGINIHVKRHR